MSVLAVYVIAEAGVNHNGSLDTAMKLVDAAAASGADAVKFQTFRAEEAVSADAPKARYQQVTTGSAESQLDMVKRLELDADAHRVLVSHCEDSGIEFLSSPFDLASIDLLVTLGVRLIKVPSGEITNLPYLRRLGALGRSLFLSTGMSSMEEVSSALEVLSEAGLDREQITLLHCTSEYPAPYEDVNLRAMEAMRAEFGLPVGYSDHTRGVEVAIAAVALGACVIEKHLTLDRTMSGPDHAASVEPDEFSSMVEAIRHIETALGDGVKRVTEGERDTLAVARKSIVAAADISAGDVFSDRNLTTKRPGSGLSPMMWDSLIGRIARRSYHSDDRIDPEELATP